MSEGSTSRMFAISFHPCASGRADGGICHCLRNIAGKSERGFREAAPATAPEGLHQRSFVNLTLTANSKTNPAVPWTSRAAPPTNRSEPSDGQTGSSQREPNWRAFRTPRGSAGRTRFGGRELTFVANRARKSGAAVRAGSARNPVITAPSRAPCNSEARHSRGIRNDA